MRKVAICVLFALFGILVSMSNARMVGPSIEYRRDRLHQENEAPKEQQGLIARAWNSIFSMFSSSKTNEHPVNKIEFSDNIAPFSRDSLEFNDRNLNDGKQRIKMIRLENQERIY